MLSDSTSKYPVLFFSIGAYLVLMMFSWFMQYTFPAPEVPNKYAQQQIVTVNGQKIQLDYLAIGEPGNGKTVVLLPDIYHEADFLIPLTKTNIPYQQKIIPIYPETDITGNKLPYSVEHRADMVSVLLDSLQVQSPDILGQAYGGLVAVNLFSNTALQNNDLGNLILLSSAGVQELQFLGSHSFNNTLYSLLYPLVLSYKYLLPHMGYYYQQPFDAPYVHSLLQTDQRRFRKQLQQIQKPVLILHPHDDNYIPLAISEETHRLLPQSYMVMPAGNHRVIADNPKEIARHITWFTDVTKQQPISRNNASDKRKAKASTPFDADQIDTIDGSTLLLIGFMLFLLTLISEDLACIGGGLLVASGVIEFHHAVVACLSGILLADVGTYLLGRWIGRPIIKVAPFRWIIKETDVERAEQAFKMKGVEIIFISRFLPGVRFPTYIVAGMLKVKFTFFLSYFFLSVIVWTPAMIWISAMVGQPMLTILEIYQDYALWVLIGGIIFIYIFAKFLIPLATVTGRRKLVITYKRFKERWIG